MTCDYNVDREFICVDTCEGFPTELRCENGASCQGGGYRGHDGWVCSAGGSNLEGAVVRLDGSADACAFGLRYVEDFTTDPLAHRCEPACDRDSDCRAGEYCVGWGDVCLPACSEPGFCGEGNTCVLGYWCTNARRLARVDCDGDGYGDCHPGGMCGTGAAACVPVVPAGDL